jgi:hypothetical protein
MDTMAVAISSGVPMRLLGTCAEETALFSFVCAKRLNIPVSTDPGDDVDMNVCAGEFDGRRLRNAFHGVPRFVVLKDHFNLGPLLAAHLPPSAASYCF